MKSKAAIAIAIANDACPEAPIEKSTKKRNHETMEASAAAVTVPASAAAVEVAKETGGAKPTSFPCRMCPFASPSEKALHGHMRRHSDRGWRGMKPPKEAPPAVGGGGEQPAQVAGNGDDGGVGGSKMKRLKRSSRPIDLNELPSPEEDDADAEIVN